MPEITKPSAGTFCWIEHASNDTKAIKKFYGDVFGWSWSDMPMPDGSTYSMGQINGKNVAGVTTIQGEAKKMNVSPHWLSYVAVDNADTALAQAGKLNGKTLMGVTDVGMGRMAVVADPTGGVFAFWQSKQSMGTFLYAENNALCWNELLTGNADVAGGFYSKLFGWKGDNQSMAPGVPPYTVFKSGDEMRAGLMPKPKDMEQAPTAWLAYFQTQSADQIVEKVKKAGGKVMQPATDIPNVGRFAVFQDPQGAAFGVLQAARK